MSSMSLAVVLWWWLTDINGAQAMKDDQLVGVVISKLEVHRGGPLRGYIAMLAVRMQHRGKGIGAPQS